jgi:prolipoprotein diacylglyceryltransferase
MVFLVFNFFQQDKYEFFIAPLSVIYVGILGLYVGTKEFDRWYEMHSGRHPGELFVIFWTIIIFVLMAIAFLSEGKYHLSSEAVAVYIMVLSVFALTQKSKSLHEKKLKEKSILNFEE